MTRAHFSKATIMGHPIHPMIVGFPIAFYTSGVITLVAYALTRNPLWFQASMYLWFAGVATALIAALFGMVDLFAGIPGRTRARRTGIKHMGLNVLALALFGGAALMLATSWYQNPTNLPLDQLGFRAALALGVIGLLLTFGAGALGGKLVYTHHVGMDEDAAPDELAAEGGEPGAMVTERGMDEPLPPPPHDAQHVIETRRPVEDGLGGLGP